MLTRTFIDLGSAPPSNAYLTEETLSKAELWYPLRVLVCSACWLVQTEDHAAADELFASDYAYFSSYSPSWVAHAERYVETIVERLRLSPGSQVIEVAANDGYLLQFVAAAGIPCLGIEPTAGAAEAARAKGIEVVEEFFGVRLARKLASRQLQADLMIANNVLAHVPDINDFVSGFAMLLKPSGVATFEFPHLLKLVQDGQFDTIYHEHFSYLSLTSVARVFERNGLYVFDVEQLPTHGGSLRISAQRADSGRQTVSTRVSELLRMEWEVGVTRDCYYGDFQSRADAIKQDFVSFLIEARRSGRRVAGYGAAAKGNTLLNYAGVRPDLLPYVVDRNPAKQGKYLPGSRIPIVAENRLRLERPDYVIILPWNLRDEISQQLSYIRDWGGQFVTAVPSLRSC